MLDIKPGISVQTKQILSQVQMESLKILSMSASELHEFLQNEEIENPLVEYSSGMHEESAPVVYREYDRFYGKVSPIDEGNGEIYQVENDGQSVEELIMNQIPGKRMGENEREIVEFCIHSLDQNGYLTMSSDEIAETLGRKPAQVMRVLAELKKLEPKGIFASGLEECLILQIRDADNGELLERMIRNHLQDVADGRISSISRDMKLSSIDVRKLIHIIKELNPRPLNGFGGDRTQYIVPDILVQRQDGQWIVSLNDKWAGALGINEFYVHMMETAHDETLKTYFEEKLKRARFITSAVEQRRQTLEGITVSIVKHQEGFFLGREPLKPMTLEEIAEEREIHKSTVSRAVRDKYLLFPSGCILMRDLFTSGISSGKNSGENGDVSRNTVKTRLKAIVDGEDKTRPYSDEQITRLLGEDGVSVSRRTVAKYRTEMGIGGAFRRREPG